MDRESVELIMHPARFRILQALVGEALTTAQLDRHLPEIATSSLYRHLRLLLDAGFLEVAEVRSVSGTPEKVYQLAQSPRLGPAEAADLNADDHLRLFTAFMLSLYRGFAAYLERAGAAGEALATALMGYTEAPLYATEEELLEALTAINRALAPLLEHRPGAGRQAYRLATVLHPLEQLGLG
jgi:DNA-binding transcriptional ArsR family regulator